MPNLRLSACGRRARLKLAPSILAFLLLASAPWSAQAVSASRMTPIVRAVQQTAPSVVDIQGRKSIEDRATAMRGMSSSRQVNGMGTGVVIDPRGYILTNHHVVDGVQQINVTLDGGHKYVAQFISGDPQTDLAVIRIRTPDPLPVIRLGTSEDLMTGETVIAIGNAFGYEHTVTTGIVSALHRNVQVNETLQYLDLIQTDASINPGNSGGPLLNVDGEMIGMNAAVRAGAQGIGFAIPVDKALEIAARMMSIQRIDDHWHGMTPLAIDGPTGPVTIADLDRKGPASECGLERGDQLVRIGGVPIKRPLDVERALLGRRSGQRVPVVVRRDGKEVETKLPIVARSTRTTRQVAVAPKDQPANDGAWQTLGLRLEPVSRAALRQLSDKFKFKGGMRVVEVRPGSSAAEEGVVRGDILVRVHRWYTTNERDVRYIVQRADSLTQLGAVRFDIVRGSKWYLGQLALVDNESISR